MIWAYIDVIILLGLSGVAIASRNDKKRFIRQSDVLQKKLNLYIAKEQKR